MTIFYPKYLATLFFTLCCLGLAGNDNILPTSADTIEPNFFSPGYQWTQSRTMLEFVPGAIITATSKRYRFAQNTVLIAGDYYYPLEVSDVEFGDDTFEDSGLHFKERDGKIFYLDPNRDDSPLTDDQDILLYDFTAEVGDTIDYQAVDLDFFEDDEAYQLFVTEIDSVTLMNGERRKRWHLGTPGRDGTLYTFFTYIEGLGCPQGLIFPLQMSPLWADLRPDILRCYSLFGETLFMNPWRLDDQSCFPTGVVSTEEADPQKATALTVYPNPAGHQLTIKGFKAEQSHLYDAAGRLQRSYGKGVTLELGDLPPGMYLLRSVNDRGNVGVARVIVR